MWESSKKYKIFFVFMIYFFILLNMKHIEFITSFLVETLNGNFKNNRFLNLKINKIVKNKNENSIHFEFDNKDFVITCVPDKITSSTSNGQ